MKSWAEIKQEQFDRLNKQYDDDSDKLSISELDELLGETQQRTLARVGFLFEHIGGPREFEILETINRRKELEQ